MHVPRCCRATWLKPALVFVVVRPRHADWGVGPLPCPSKGNCPGRRGVAPPVPVGLGEATRYVCPPTQGFSPSARAAPVGVPRPGCVAPVCPGTGLPFPGQPNHTSAPGPPVTVISVRWNPRRATPSSCLGTAPQPRPRGVAPEGPPGPRCVKVRAQLSRGVSWGPCQAA